MTTTQTNNATDDRSELTETDVQARIVAKNAAMTSEQRAALETKAQEWQMPTTDVENTVNVTLAESGLGSVNRNKVNAILAANQAAGEHNKEEIANQVIASEVADKMMRGDVSQAAVDNLYNQFGDGAVTAKNTIRDGAGDYGTLKTAGDIIGSATPPEKTADEARAELTIKSQEGGLNTQEQATAEVLGVEAEKQEATGDDMKDIEGQIAELQAALDNEVINFEDISKLKDLQNKLIDLKVQEMSNGAGAVANQERIDSGVEQVNDITAALEHAKNLAEEYADDHELKRAA